MTLPARSEIALPMLNVIQDGEVHAMANVVDRLSERFKLSNADKSLLAADGRHSRFYYECQWMLHVLKKSDMIKTSKWGYFQITQMGLDAIKRPDIFDFVAFR